MAVHDTEDNNRTWMTEATLRSLAFRVNWDKHRLFVIDNGSCEETIQLYDRFEFMPMTIIRNQRNIGTAKAINLGWKHRLPGEHCVKMDNDVVIHQPEWVDQMEEVFEVDPKIGICGLKRKDLAESPFSEGHFKSSIRMLPHEKGHRWLIVEDVENVMGTCQAYSSLLLDKIGYLVQPGVYGFDDVLSSLRARLAGFDRVFLHGFDIDHIDPGGSPYSQWKIREAGNHWKNYQSQALLYESGVIPIYHED